MEHLINEFPHMLLHALKETALLLPFLFLTYLLMEFLEHKSGNAAANWLRGSGKIGPLVGGAFGVVPQCGFSAAAAGLYSGRILTTGTLLAVFLSTSDEMLPILISNGASPILILKLLGTKLIVGVASGFLVDVVTRLIHRRRHKPEAEPAIEELCEREGCRCGEHFVWSAIKHTLQVAVFVFLFTTVLHVVIHLLGEDTLAAWLTDKKVLATVLAAVVGLIPNCASSILLTELYLSGILSVGALLAGLLVNAGMGLALLFRNNRPVRDSLRILLILWCIGTLVGLLIDLTPLAALF